MWGETKARRALVMAAAPLLSVVSFVGVASAQPTFSDAQVCQTADLADAHMWVGGPQFSSVVSIAIPAGTVAIPEAISWDEYPGRASVAVQTSERWELQFLDASGNVLATSEATPDVADGVLRGEFIGSLPSVTLPAGVVGIRSHHRPDLPGNGTPASVHASGVTLCWDEPPVCTDSAGNPVTPLADGSCPPSGPTIPPSCPNGTGGTVPPNADGSCPTTTTAPVCRDAAGNPVTPNADGTCPTSTTSPVCRDAAGNPITPNANGTCPTPTTAAPTTTAPPPAGPTIAPTVAPPPAGPSALPVTGSEASIFLLGGLWLIAAGTTATLYVRRP